MALGYQCWKILNRELLVRIFPTQYPVVRADHVTHLYGVENCAPFDNPQTITTGRLVGYANDGEIEAYILSINNKIFRPDGQVYHATWSMKPGVRSVRSNEMIRACWDGEVISSMPVKLAAEFRLID